MQASNLLRTDKAQVTAAYLPFWLFSCSVTSEYKATLGFKDSRYVHGQGENCRLSQVIKV